jgi:shikimate dehydrogenase
LKVNGKTKILAIFGNPVKHSRSPELQNKWIGENDLNWIYVPFKVDRIDTAISALCDLNFLGANVTIPFKVDCMKFLDEIDESAKSVGAVNTIVNRNKKLIGYNTDVEGFKKDIEHSIQNAKNVLIYGAGGASKAAITALKFLNKKVTVINRTHKKAEQLSEQFDIECCRFEDLNKEKFEAFVNCSPVGMDKVSSPIELQDFPNLRFVYDMVYEPEESPLLYLAKSLGIKNKNGYGMLVEQGKAAFRLWQNVEIID